MKLSKVLNYLNRHLFSLYSYNYPRVLLKVLVETDYSERMYLKNLWKKKDFTLSKQKAKLTKNSKRLLLYAYAGIVLELVLAIFLIVMGLRNKVTGGAYFGIALIIAYPLIWAHLILLPIYFRNIDKALPETTS